MPEAEIRPFRTLEEMKACVALQEAVWGHGFSERVPVSLLKVTQRLGGVAAGAYDDDGRLVGFVFGLTGIEDGTPVHWSDMLAVLPGLRDSGLGTRLKSYQREVLLARNVTTMYWTFDPLESKNAHLNFGKLGIVVREYIRDMYGDSDSPLHRGIGTDRFVALWRMDTPRVGRRLDGVERPPDRSVLGTGRRVISVSAPVPGGSRESPEAPAGEASPPARDRDAGGEVVPVPVEPVLDATGDRLFVPIPASIQDLKRADPGAAVRWREATRSVLVHYLGAGYEVRELVRDGDLSWYLLERTEGAESAGGVADG